MPLAPDSTTLTTARQATAVVRLTVPRSQIQTVMGPAISEVFAALAAQGLTPAGPLFSYHLRMDSSVFDLEVGVPVGASFQPSGRVVASELPAVEVARGVHEGAYEGLGPSWGEFRARLEAQGLTAAEGLWECYARGPESSPDPANWRTELNQPLRR